MLLTFGLLSPNKGIEHVLNALPHSCGSLIHRRKLIIPYAMADSATTFATLSLDEVLAAMEPA